MLQVNSKPEASLEQNPCSPHPSCSGISSFMASERAGCGPSLCSPGLRNAGMVGKRIASQPGVKLAGWLPALNHNAKLYTLKD